MRKASEFVCIYIAGLPGELCGHQIRMSAAEAAQQVVWKEQSAKEGFLKFAPLMMKGDFYQATSSVTILCVYNGSPRKEDPEVLELLDTLNEVLDEYDEHQMISATDHYRELIVNARAKFTGKRKMAK